MKFEWLTLFLLLLMCVTVGAALLTAEPADGHGVQHGEYVAMQKGSPTPPTDRIVTLGWIFGLLQVAFFVTCMSLGIKRTFVRGRGLLVLLFSVGTLLYGGVMTLVVFVDHSAIRSGQVSFFGPFPAATSWMLFGLWLSPLVFVVAYVIGFSRWILPPEALAKFEELVATNRHKTAESSETSPNQT